MKEIRTNTVGFYSPFEFISKLFDWATGDKESAGVEKAKPKKQPINFAARKLSGNQLELNQQ